MTSLRKAGFGLEFLRSIVMLFVIVLLGTSSLEAQCTADAGNNITICSGQPIQIGGNPTAVDPNNAANVTYSWAIGNGVPFSTISNPNVNPTTTTTYTVDLSGGGCNGESDQVVVTVIPAAFAVTANANGGPNAITICAGSSLDLSSTAASAPAGVSYDWDGPNGYNNSSANPPAFNAGPNSGGTYTVTASVGDCEVSDNITIDVIYPFLSSNQLQDFQGQEYLVKCVTGAAGGNISISDATPANFDASISSYTINWGDGSPVSTSNDDNWASLIHYYVNGLYTLTLTATGPSNCPATHTYQVFVGSEPAVSLGTPGNTSGCAPRTLTFPVTLTENNIQGTTYVIDFGDGSPTQSFNHPPPSTVTHTFTGSSCGETFGSNANAFGVTLVATNPCGNSEATVAPIRISTPPTAGFTANPETICVNQVSTMTSTANPGTTATASSCTSTAIMYWAIAPAAGWTASGLGSANNFGVTDYDLWTAGSTTLPVTFSLPGTYTVTQTLANGCGGDDEQRTICVIPPPTCAFTLTPSSGCSVLDVASNNTSQPPSCNGVPLALQYNWTISPPSGGTGSSSISNPTVLNPTFSFTNSGTTNITFTVSLTVAPINPQTGLAMSCTTNCTQTVTVFPSPVIASPPAAQVNCGPFNPTSIALSFTGGAANPQFQWYSTTNPTNPGGPGNLGTAISGATTSSYDPPNTINVSTYYFCTITYTGVPNCSSYQSGLFQAIVNPVPTVTAGIDQTICSTSSANLSASGSGGSGALSYSWSPASGLTDASISNPVANPSVTTPYNVTVTDANGCTATDVIVVTVSTAVTADVTGTYSFCGAQTFTLSGTANGPGQWTSSTGTFSNPTSINSSYTPSAGQVGTTFPLIWTTTDPDGTGPTGPCPAATDQVSVTITAAGTSTPTTPITICSGATASLSVTTTPATGSWSGGSGTFTNNQLPATVYTPGPSDVGNSSLILVWTTADPDGIGPCQPLTVNQPLSVIGTATANAGGPYAICGSTAISLSGSANGNGQWAGGAGVFSNVTSVTSTYIPATGEVGTTVNLTWTTNDPDGTGPCNSANDQATVTVSTPATFTPLTPITICSSSTASLSVSTTPATGSWSGGSGTFANATSGTTIYTPGPNDVANANLTLVWTTSDPDGAAGPCPSITVDQPVDVIETSTADAGGLYEICGASSISLTAIANGAGQWTGGLGTYSNASLVNSTYTPATSEVGNSVTLTWTTNDPDGTGPCTSANDQATVTVSTPATFTPLTPITICSSSTASLSVSTTPATGSWSGGSGTFANATSGTTIYTPGPNDVANANLTLVWTTSDPDGAAGPCPSITVDQPVDVIETSTADAGGLYEICGASSISLTAIANGAGQWTGGLGTYSNASLVNSTYTPDASEVGNSVTITWTTNDPDGTGPCTSATDQANVTVSTPATFTPLTPITICSSSTASLQVITLPTTGSWSGGGGSFANANSATTVYTPGGNDVTNTSLNLVWTTSDPDGAAGPCPSITVDQPLDVIETSTADAGGLYEICGASSISLTAIANGAGQWTGGSGTFSNASLVNSTYTPATTEVGNSVTLTWTTNDPDGAGPCNSATDQATVAVSTPATFTPLTPITICSSSTASLSVSTTPATGSWSGGSGTFANATSATTIYTPGPNDVAIANLTLVWTTSDPDGAAGPCPSITVDQPVGIIGTSTADAGGPYEVCGAVPIVLLAAANGGGQWSGGVGTFFDAADVGTSYTPALSEVGTTINLTWTTNDPDGGGPCLDANDVGTLDISAPAVLAPFTQLTICSNAVAQLSATSTPSSGTWSTADGTGTFANATNPQTTYTPGTNETGSIEIRWTTSDPDNSGPCLPISEPLTLDILQTAIAEITTTYTVCANASVSIAVQENGTGEWTVEPLTAGTFADSSLSSTQFIPSVDYYTAQNLQITWTTFDPDGIGPCLSATDFTTVDILPLPQITMAPSFSIPCGDDISATVSTYQNVPYTFSWTPEAGLIEPDQLTTPAVGDDDYALQVIDANGCVNADTTTVDAIALANMASAADASTCLYVPIQLSGSAADGQGPFTYNWVATEEVSPSALDNTLADFVFDDYILQDSILNIEFEVSDLYGCTDDTIISVTVFALPAIDPGQNWDLCEDSPVFTLTNFSPQPSTGISGVWTPSDIVNPDQIGVDAVTYTYTFTDNNGCVNDSSMLVSINEVPQAVMVVPSVACVETPLPLENNSSCGTCSNVSYEWDFGIANSTSNAFEPSFVYSVNDIGLTTVQLVAMSGFGCDDTTTAVVDIVPPPVPLFEATYNQPSCAPLAVDISHNTDTTGLYLSYEWTIEDITENNIVGVYNTFLPPPIVLQQGDSIVDYTITLMVSNVCGNYDTDTVVSVLPQPVADILTSTVYGCTPLVVDFINESVGLPDAIEWDFGDNTFSGMETPPPHTFYTDSTITIYNLVVALENECGVDTFFQDITVLPNTVNALFVTSTAAGCTPLEVTFNDFSTGASQLNFTLCNGVTFSGESFTYTFTEPGDCVVELVADNGCSYDTTSVSIFVVQSPEPAIVADDSFCANEPIEFTANNALNAMLTWNFSDGSPQPTGNPVEHAYTDAGDYVVELLSENNLFGVQCENTTTHPVHISPNPQAAFTIPTNFGCSPFNLCFTNLSSTSDPNQSLSQQWNFDGVNVDNDFSPCHIYTNQTGELVYYTVTLEVTAADIQYMQTCTSSTSQNILLLPQPICDFEMADPYTCYFPYELATTNTTEGGGAYQWLFNGQNWTEQTNTSFPINDLGAYDIDLIATNQYGCTDTSQQVFNSYPLPTLDFTFDLNDGCDPLMVQFDNLSTGNNTYTWLFDDGTQATLQDIVHEYTNPGSYDVMLVGTTENNCTDTLTIEDPILVYPVPVADFIFAPEEVNILDPQMTFEETGFGGSYFHWDFNDGSEDYGAIVAHSFNNAYYHAVTLTAYNQYGCTDDITKSVFVSDYLTVYVPNSFTPDGDRINDVFRPEMGGKELISRYKFWITDRWGEVLFRTNDYDEPWLGDVRDGEHFVSPGSYIWNLEVELKNGEEREYNGHVIVVR